MAVVLVQEHFRVRTDTTAAEGGTPVWAAAQDTNATIGTGTNFRIRFAISNTGASANNSIKELFASRNSGAFALVTTSTTFVQCVDTTAGASADNSAITTQLLTGVGTFSAFGVYDDTGVTAAAGIAGSSCVEHEFGIVITASASVGDTFDFEMRNTTSGTLFTTYNATPRITVGSGADILYPRACL